MYTFKEYIKKEDVISNLIDRFTIKDKDGNETTNMHRVKFVFNGMVDNLKGKYNAIVRRRNKNKVARKSRRINRMR